MWGGDGFSRAVAFVTTHNRLTILVVLVATAAMVVGVGNLEVDDQSNLESDEFDHLERVQGSQYVDERYADDTDTVTSYVYVRAADGDVFSRDELLAALEFQQTVSEEEAVAGALANGRSIEGIPNVIARELADGANPELADQIAALEAADDDTVAATVESTLSDGSRYQDLLPRSYDPDAASGETHRMAFRFDSDTDDQPPSAAQEVLYDHAQDREDPEYFTVGEHAAAAWSETFFDNLITLVVPLAFVLLAVVLAVTYRDLIDVVVSLIGVAVSLVWMIGILGWLGIEANPTALIIAPVVILAVAVDFSFHIFMRYREFRDEDGANEPQMRRAVYAVGIALVLVVVTAGIGFLSNLTSPLSSIRALGVAITLGILSAFLIFLTLVPALKLSIDGVIERLGRDRHTPPIGTDPRLGRLLTSCVEVTRRAPVVILLIALVIGASGIVAWGALDHEAVQQSDEEPAEWKQSLPGPLAWEDHEYETHTRYVERQFPPDADDELFRAEVLIEGDVTDPGTLESVQTLVETANERDVAAPAGSDTLQSPVTLVQSVADANETAGAIIAEADTTGNGIPDRDLKSVYDAVYATAPSEASRVLERTEDGEYRSSRVIILVDPTLDIEKRVDRMDNATAAATRADDPITMTLVDTAAVQAAIVSDLAAGVFRMLLIALVVISVVVTGSYRVVHGTATLGVVTVVPIVLVTALVFVGMYLLSVPVTLLTALLLSLVLGLGIDYSIHVSERFVQELERGNDMREAVAEAVTGTGGALLGTTLTTVSVFATLLLVPHPQLQSLGLMVALAMTAAFVAAVLVLPALLVVWSRYTGQERQFSDRVRSRDESAETGPT